jgi:hypothetical protein
MPMKSMQDKAEEYLTNAKAAEDQAAKILDPQLKTSFEGIARAYRAMAERAQKLLDDDPTQQP